MILRPFTPADASTVSNIIITNLRTYYANAWDLEDYCNMYKPQLLIKIAQIENVYVVEDNGKLIATGSIRGNELRAIFVEKIEHAKGIGKWLIAQLEGILKEQDQTRAFLLSGKFAVGFYEKMGYKKTGNVFAKGEDIEMEKML